MVKQMTLTDVFNHFGKFNRMGFTKERAVKMAKLLVEKFGFEDKKNYHYFGMIQMFNWETGDGTLFLKGHGKVEIGKYPFSRKGWFLVDFDK
jgi:hypothetical protein